jgi:hypothetical protein
VRANPGFMRLEWEPKGGRCLLWKEGLEVVCFVAPAWMDLPSCMTVICQRPFRLRVAPGSFTFAIFGSCGPPGTGMYSGRWGRFLMSTGIPRLRLSV